MKKIIFASLMLAAAVCFSGCGSKVKKDGEVSSNTAGTESVTESETDEPLATERERNIVSTEEYDYEVVDGGVIITSYKGKDSNVEIPAEIDGTPVTEVGFYAFEAKPDLVSVALPESVTVIGEGVAGCISLTELTIPAEVTRIQQQAFTACTGMRTLTILSQDLKYEGWGLEELPDITVFAPEGSAAAEWAGAMGKYAVY